MGDVTDGTSNTLMVGEQGGDVVRGTAGKRDVRAAYHCGWSGFSHGLSGSTTPFQPAELPDGTHFYGTGTTTVRYPINTKTCVSMSGCYNPYDMNTVLNSMHPGGAQTVFVDGSVHFLSETILMETFLRLAAKDDGLVVGEF
jgi:prepilin-type processing-associated H-X9-DG protein